MNYFIKQALSGAALLGVAVGSMANNDGGKEGINVFLADPELGVIGSYSVAGSTVYFEARDDGHGAIAARLLDENGREIAVAGGANLEDWGHSIYEPEAAMKSQYAVGELASAIGLAMSEPALVPEQNALTELTQQVSFTDLSHGPYYPQIPTPLAFSKNRVASDTYYQDKAAELVLGLGKDGNGLSGKYRGVKLTAFTEEFTDEVGDDGEKLPPRQEVYARITVDGRVLDSTFGGDLVPEGWSHEAENTAVAHDANPFEQMGRAVMAAQLLSKSIGSDRNSSLELSTLIDMGSSLRKHLLPVPLTDVELEEFGSNTGFSAKGYRYLTQAHIFRKPLVTGNFTGRHSGLREMHYVKWNNGSSVYNHRHNRCNHGACPGASSMKYKCYKSSGWRSNWRHGASCSTSYGICLGSSKHNCHDDTARQFKKIKRGSTWGAKSGRCSSFTCARYELSCSDY